jgi:magnesium-transporting ATPase (P-type)
MLYLGTAIAAGRAVAVVVNTGTATQLGKIGRLVATATKERSPLEIQLTHLGRRLVYLVLLIATTVMITGWFRGDGLWLMVEVSISLAVAAVPEGLPAVTTLILALGVLRMARSFPLCPFNSATRSIAARAPDQHFLAYSVIVFSGWLCLSSSSCNCWLRTFHHSLGFSIPANRR